MVRIPEQLLEERVSDVAAPLVLSEIRCDENGGHNDIPLLIFKPVSR